jgi:hypothetical protein
MYVQCSIQALSCNHCCSEKSIRITYSECVFVALKYPARNAHAPYCHLWPIQLYNILPHYLINGKILRENNKEKKYALIFYKTFVCNISRSKKIKIRLNKKKFVFL